jgi:hypothetical protein
MRDIGVAADLSAAGGVRFVHGRSLAVGFVVAALVAAPALAQNLDEGKTPQQLFAADCAACHKSPQGLGRNASVGFLRQHYTSSARSASLLAGYLASAGAAPNPDRQKTRAEEREKRKKGDQAAVAHTGEPATAAPAAAAHQPGRKDSRKSRRPVQPGASEPAGTGAGSPAAPAAGPAEGPTASAAPSHSPAASPGPMGTPPAPSWDEAAMAALSAPPPKPQPVFAAPLP